MQCCLGFTIEHTTRKNLLYFVKQNHKKLPKTAKIRRNLVQICMSDAPIVAINNSSLSLPLIKVQLGTPPMAQTISRKYIKVSKQIQIILNV